MEARIRPTGIPTPRPIVRVLDEAGGEGGGVSGMMISDEDELSGGCVGVVDVESVLLDAAALLVVEELDGSVVVATPKVSVGSSVDVVLEEEVCTEVGASIFEMLATISPSGTSIFSLPFVVQQSKDRSPSQHQLPSSHCWIASLPGAVPSRQKSVNQSARPFI